MSYFSENISEMFRHGCKLICIHVPINLFATSLARGWIFFPLSHSWVIQVQDPAVLSNSTKYWLESKKLIIPQRYVFIEQIAEDKKVKKNTDMRLLQFFGTDEDITIRLWSKDSIRFGIREALWDWMQI